MLDAKESKNKSIVISAVNLTEAGPLSILRECLFYLSNNLCNKYDVIALVNNKELINVDRITYHEFTKAKKTWLNRLYYEYVYFKKLSRKFKPYLWFSLHDITPNVDAKVRAVYCHNSSPAYRLSLRDVWLEPKFALFNKFYKFLYKINISKNDFVVVQQHWWREHLRKLFGLRNNVIVAPPEVNHINALNDNERNNQSQTAVFFYPAFPRVFKNFELICEAAKLLVENKVKNFEVFLTINGNENRYARYIFKKYKNIQPLRFIGWQSREKVYEYYKKAKCLLFPSKLESFGLPVIEFKKFSKPILLADLQHCREALGAYDKVKFFDPDDTIELSNLMKGIINDTMKYERTADTKIEKPFARNWHALFNILLNEDNV